MKNKDKKRVSETGWMPFWWGNKFNRRLSSKRVRQHEKKELDKEIAELKGEYAEAEQDV